MMRTALARIICCGIALAVNLALYHAPDAGVTADGPPRRAGTPPPAPPDL